MLYKKGIRKSKKKVRSDMMVDMQIKAVIHDWDDTITNAFETYAQFYFDLGEFYDFKNPGIEKLKEHWGGTISEIVNGMWPNLSPEEAVDKVDSFWKEVKAGKKVYTAKVFPQIKETIFELDRLGVKLGVISSGDVEQIKKLYKEHIEENLRYHCFIFDHKDLGCKKPDPKVFDMAFERLKKFNITERETIYVGDSFQDYAAAKNRGLTFYAVTTGLKTKDDFVKEGLSHQYILQDFNDILTIFQ